MRATRRLYYHPKKRKYLILTTIPYDSVVVIEDTDSYSRRYLKGKNYQTPSKRGFKFIGELL